MLRFGEYARIGLGVGFVLWGSGCTVSELLDTKDTTKDGLPETTTSPDDTDTVPPDPELECDDERDDDDDGLVDCDDDDCAGVELCTWPTQIDFETLIEFDANAIAELGGYGDCTVHVTAPLARDRAESCEGCDRVYAGEFTFLEDDCPEDIERPQDGGYGIDFRSETEWEVFGRVEAVWTSLGVAQDDGTGTMRISDSTPVEAYGVDVGTVSTFFSFTPLD